MNQLYLLNHNRVLATRYKIKLEKKLSSFCVRVCMQDEDTNLCYKIFCEQQSNTLYLSLCIIYYILFVFVCFSFVFFSACIFSICKTIMYVYVIVWLCFISFFFFFCSLRVLYSSSHKHVVFFLSFFFCYFCSDKILMMIN